MSSITSFLFLMLILPLITAFPASTDAPTPLPTSSQASPKITSAPQLPAHLDRRGYPRDSFSSFPGYSTLRNCARACLEGSNGGYYMGIWDYADCDEDSCACQADDQPIVVRSLKSCISSLCTFTGTADFDGATSVYALFCSSVTGDPSDVLPTAGTEGSAPVTVTQLSTVTVESSSSKLMSEFVVLLLVVSEPI